MPLLVSCGVTAAALRRIREVRLLAADEIGWRLDAEVRAFVRAAATEAELRAALEAFVAGCENSLLAVDFDVHRYLVDRVHHALAAELAWQRSPRTTGCVRYLEGLAVWAHAVGDLEHARDLLESARVIDLEFHRVSRGTVVCQLARICCELGDRSAARFLLDEIHRESWDVEDRSCAAQVLAMLGDVEAARDLLQGVVDEHTRTLGDDHVCAAAARLSLAAMHHQLGAVEAAVELLGRVLTGARAGPLAVAALCGLATIHALRGDDVSAHGFALRARDAMAGDSDVSLLHLMVARSLAVVDATSDGRERQAVPSTR